MAGALGGVNEGSHSQFTGLRAQFGNRVDGAERVRNVHHGEQLHLPGQEAVQVREIQQPLITGDRHKSQPRSGALGQQLPRHEVTVVLHLRE